MHLLDGLDRDVLGYIAMALFVIGATVAITLMLLDPQSGVRKRWSNYVAGLDKELRFLFYETPAKKIAKNQLYIILGLTVGSVFLREFLLILVVPAVAFLPMVILKRRHVERVEAIELQLDTWLLILANALKATPSLGEAVRSSAKIMRKPIAQDLDLLLKEVNLGTPLDQAVLGMSNRIGSRTVAGALATILIGRQTGGDLPMILEESAATLREMQRLEGVVRTKTAEGKSQAYVLGVIPFVLIGAIHLIDPHWLAPLTETTIGYLVITISMVLWVGAIFAARKILAVDV